MSKPTASRPDRSSSARALALFPSLAFAVLAASPAPTTGNGERFTLSGPSIAIYDLAGNVTVEAASASETSIEVVRRGSDASRLRVEAGPVGSVQTLRVIFPADRILFPDADRGFTDHVQVGDDGRFADRALFPDDSSPRHVVTIASHGSGLDASADLHVRVPNGRRVSLFVVAGAVSVTNVDGDLRVDASSATVTTQHTRGALSLDTGSGAVRVRDAQGELTIDSGSGDAIVRGVRGAGLHLDTGSGAVTVVDAQIETLDADTGSGAVTIVDTHAPEIRLDSGSGSVNLELLPGALRSLSVDSGSGGVTIGVPRDLNASFDIDAGSGGVRIQVPHAVEFREGDHLRGRFGDGRGRIHIDGGSGGVKILPHHASESGQESGLGSFLRISFA
jgi:lia operon protein LiaG